MERTERPWKEAPSPRLLISYLVLHGLVTTGLGSRTLEQEALTDQKNYYTPTPVVPHPHPSPVKPPSHPSPTTPYPAPARSHPPAAPIPPPPYEPNIPPFHPGNCRYWITHPEKIAAVLGYLETVADIFGRGSVLALGGKNPSLRDALEYTSGDGIGALVREGTAALLNSMACKSFPLTTEQVKGAFAAALGSDGEASAQAEVFKLANEGRYGHKA